MKHFNESLNTAVFTTQYVMRGNSPILFIYHFDDGSWQFSGIEDNLTDNDYMVVALEEIINHDPSVLEVADMPEGFQAIRNNKKGEWRVVSKN